MLVDSGYSWVRITVSVFVLSARFLKGRLGHVLWCSFFSVFLVFVSCQKFERMNFCVTEV